MIREGPFENEVQIHRYLKKQKNMGFNEQLKLSNEIIKQK
jgi:hypothetical protein